MSEIEIENVVTDLLDRVTDLEGTIKEMNRPSVLFRVKPQYIEGQAIYVATHEGKSGYGPDEKSALESFDKIWNMKIEQVKNPNIRAGHVHM